MDIGEIRKKSREELDTLLLSLHRDRFRYKLQHATGQLNQVHLFKQVKSDIARVKTVLNSSDIRE